MATFLSGAAFGAAMLAAGFYNPAIVLAQLKFENSHMIQAFLAATAASAVAYSVLEKLGVVSLKPRSNSPLGVLSRYDGNITGGSLLGAGMALSGSCPGTMLAQMGAGVTTGFYVFQGAVLGGILYTGFIARAVKVSNDKAGTKAEVSTLNEALGLSRTATAALLEMACAAAVIGTVVYTSPAPGLKIPGWQGGLLIGCAQLFSMLTRRSMMGVSGSYEEAGKYVWWLLGGADSASQPGYANMVFAGGVAAGAWALGRLVPGIIVGPVQELPPALAISGGALMIIGSRLAGGCTSGHGISGMSLLSTSSAITIMSMFGAGSAVALSFL
ncbi:uncharacterized protein J7T54_006839 [Emericellopsis cladophorae]|uniref:Sulphur transport domain-containing protein n=1 Tax=Emericellopsis cladophorae TaxID=2686198 RepID=A0A9Q0BH60_9HYPO|nr:uncharacterized protein J7T54_006839 [Emericellopsis cladophorae]KAI6785197.1 hypothetical protein J7T54_006839 [Emericellopsis cladophorae]